jgi:hypothetical protein
VIYSVAGMSAQQRQLYDLLVIKLMGIKVALDIKGEEWGEIEIVAAAS